jgi:hypothetical protein
VAVLAAVVIGAIVVVAIRTPAGKPKAACALLIDRTNSVQTSKTTELYRRLARDTVQQCANVDGNLAVWTIQQSGAQAQNVGNFPLYGVGRNNPIRNRSKAENENLAYGAINRTLLQTAGTGIGSSNIAATINEAASSLQATSRQMGGVSKYMVILTDGMQLADGVSVSSLSSILSDPAVLVKEAQRVNPQFQLQGVNVSFIGVNAGQMASNGQQLPMWFEKKVNIFWFELVTAGQGKLCTYQGDEPSSNVLLNCGAS